MSEVAGPLKFELSNHIKAGVSSMGGSVIADVPFLFGLTEQAKENTKKYYKDANSPMPPTKKVNFGSGFSNPTGNCQIFCVANFNSALTSFRFPHTASFASKKTWKDEFAKCDKTQFPEYIRFIRTNCGGGKRMMLIDLHAQWDDVVTELFGNKIMMRTPYKSTLSSSMILYFINVTDI